MKDLGIYNPTWHDRARCRDEDVNLFHPEKYTLRNVAAAKVICDQCPFRKTCRTWILEYEPPTRRSGIYAGLTPADRRGLADGQLKICPSCDQVVPRDAECCGAEPTATSQAPQLVSTEAA